MSEVMNVSGDVQGDECLILQIWAMNVSGDECRGDECRTINSYTGGNPIKFDFLS